MKKYLFKSDRLGFRIWSKEDLIPFGKMNQDKDVMEFFPSLLTIEQSHAMIDRLNQHYEDHGHTFYAVDELNSCKFIGFIGLVITTFESHFTPCLEIGWRLVPEIWGKGFATEGAKRCLKYAFEDLEKSEVYSFTALINSRSERIMQKIGMHKIDEFEHPKVDPQHQLSKHVLYKISKKEA